MKSTYEQNFQTEIERILNELYFNSIDMGEKKIKRAVIKTEKRYIRYLLDYCLVSDLKTSNGGEWGLQLESNGFEVFEKYSNWAEYKKKVIDQREKIEKAKNIAIKYWWLPVTISVISLIMSILSFFQ